MRYAIISDVHANPTALERVLADARKHCVVRIVCLGDVVGYGPQPAEAVELVRKNCYFALAGNHDDAVSGRADASEFIDLAKDAVERHRAELSHEQLEWLGSLPYTCELEGAIASHADFCDPPKFYYIQEESDAEANFGASDAQLMFVGHTHEPALFVTGHSGAVYKTDPQDFTLEGHKRYIVNPGSVGYPRESDGKCLSSYVIYDSDAHTVSFRYVPFQVSSVMQRGGLSGPVRKRIIAVASAVAALVAAVAVWALVPKSIEVVDDPALMVETKEIPLDSDLKSVSANLVLERDSDPVQLRVTFETASGDLSGVESLTVKQSSRKKLKIPNGSVRATFSLVKSRREDSVKVAGFAPSASTK